MAEFSRAMYRPANEFSRVRAHAAACACRGGKGGFEVVLETYTAYC